MTNQEVFDTVVRHLKVQGKRSGVYKANPPWPEKFYCLYRGPNNTSCAVGCLIPDDMYSPDLENRPAGAAAINWILLELDISPGLASGLQRVHDSSMSWNSNANMRSALNVVAKDYKLDYSLVTELWSDNDASKGAADELGSL